MGNEGEGGSAGGIDSTWGLPISVEVRGEVDNGPQPPTTNWKFYVYIVNIKYSTTN
jgi:hypothetical protein